MLLGVVVLGGSRDDEDDLSGQGGNNLSSTRGLRSEVDVDTLRLLDVDGGENSVGLDVDLLSVQDVDGGDDIVEDNVGLGRTLCLVDASKGISEELAGSHERIREKLKICETSDCARS